MKCLEEQLNAGIHTKSGKSLLNAFLRARTAFGFEYLISLSAEHSDADRDSSCSVIVRVSVVLKRTVGNRRTSFQKSTKWRRENGLEDLNLAK